MIRTKPHPRRPMGRRRKPSVSCRSRFRISGRPSSRARRYRQGCSRRLNGRLSIARSVAIGTFRTSIGFLWSAAGILAQLGIGQRALLDKGAIELVDHLGIGEPTPVAGFLGMCRWSHRQRYRECSRMKKEGGRNSRNDEQEVFHMEVTEEVMIETGNAAVF